MRGVFPAMTHSSLLLSVVLLTAFCDRGTAFLQPWARQNQAYKLVNLLEQRGNQEIDIDDVMKEAKDALQAAEAASPTPSPPRSVASSASASTARTKDILGAGASGAVLGAVLGVVAVTQINLGPEINPLVVTGGVAVTVAGAAFAVANRNDRAAEWTRALLGRPAVGLFNAAVDRVQTAATNTVTEIQAVPTRVATAVQQQAEKTVDEIQRLPEKISDAAVQAVSDTQTAAAQAVQDTQAAAARQVQATVQDIQALPERAKTAAVDAAEEFAAELYATPGRVAESAQQRAAQTVAETQQKINAAVEDIAALPDKILESVKESGNTISRSFALSQTTIPQPPKMPPPVPVETKEASPKLELPKLELPKVELPKVELPKIELPKVDLSLPQRTVAPPKPSSLPNDAQVRAQKQAAAEAAAKKAIAQAQQRRENDAAASKAAAAAEQAKVQRQQAAAAAAQAKQAQQRKAVQDQQQQKVNEIKASVSRKREQDQVEEERRRKIQEAAAAKRKAQQDELTRQVRAASAEADAKRQQQQAELKKQQAEKQKADQEAKKKQAADAAAKQKAAVEAKKRQEQETLRKAEETLQRSRAQEAARKAAAAEQVKRQVEAKKQLEADRKAAAATAQLQKQQATAPKGASFAIVNKLSQAPRGVPTVVKWTKRRDGGISGRIYGSSNFNDGERIETSPIESGLVENGSVVKTGSGSRYFLSNDPPSGKADAFKSLLSAIPGATITLTKQAKEQDAKAALQSMKSTVRPSATFSLFGPAKISPPPASVGKTVAPQQTSLEKVAPKGVPTIRRWRKNRDGSVTGRIFGSPSFTDGEQITTSPIAQGSLDKGEVVRTGSGSRYFLE